MRRDDWKACQTHRNTHENAHRICTNKMGVRCGCVQCECHVRYAITSNSSELMMAEVHSIITTHEARAHNLKYNLKWLQLFISDRKKK